MSERPEVFIIQIRREECELLIEFGSDPTQNGRKHLVRRTPDRPEEHDGARMSGEHFAPIPFESGKQWKHRRKFA
jgi:hypothetical protein